MLSARLDNIVLIVTGVPQSFERRFGHCMKRGRSYLTDRNMNKALIVLSDEIIIGLSVLRSQEFLAMVRR